MRPLSKKELLIVDKYFSESALKTNKLKFSHVGRKQMLWHYYLRMQAIEAGLYLDLYDFPYREVDVRQVYFLDASKTAKVFLDKLIFIDSIISQAEAEYLRDRFEQAICGNKDLKSIDFEMRVFCLAASGGTRTVQFGDPLSKGCDIHVEVGGEEFSIACKSLRNETDYENSALYFHQILQILTSNYDEIIRNSSNFLAFEIKHILALRDPSKQNEVARLIAQIYEDPKPREDKYVYLIHAAPFGSSPVAFFHEARKRREQTFGPMETDNIYSHMLVQSFGSGHDGAVFIIGTQPNGLRKRLQKVIKNSAHNTTHRQNPVIFFNLESSGSKFWPLSQNTNQSASADWKTCWDAIENSTNKNRFSWIGLYQNLPPVDAAVPGLIHDPVKFELRPNTNMKTHTYPPFVSFEGHFYNL